MLNIFGCHHSRCAWETKTRVVDVLTLRRVMDSEDDGAECLRDYEQTKIAVKRMYLRFKGKGEKYLRIIQELQTAIVQLTNDKQLLEDTNIQLRQENQKVAAELQQAHNTIEQLHQLYGSRGRDHDVEAGTKRASDTQDESGIASSEETTSQGTVPNTEPVAQEKEVAIPDSPIPSQYVHDDSLNLDDLGAGSLPPNIETEYQDEGFQVYQPAKRQKPNEPIIFIKEEESQERLARIPLRDISNTTNNTTELKTSDEKKYTLDYFLNRNWHPGDFVLNPKYDSDIRGRRVDVCQHGTDCESCRKFYAMAGQGMEPEGPKWKHEAKSTANLEASSASHNRTRSNWKRPASPPGFWRSEFPSTQENEDERAKMQLIRDASSKERLSEALKRGKWILRDPLLQKRLMDLQGQHSQC